MARSTSAKTEAKGEIEVDLEPEHVLGTDIPKYYATSIQTMASGNNVSLVFSGQRPIIIGTGATRKTGDQSTLLISVPSKDRRNAGETRSPAMAESGKYIVISTAIIDELTEVRLYDETVGHVKERHPEIPIELPSMTTATAGAIANPTHVEETYDQSYVFVDAETTNRSGDPLRVPVKVIEGTSGRVKTVYFASTEGERKIVWRRTNE
jgi:hypothetical protein